MGRTFVGVDGLLQMAAYGFATLDGTLDSQLTLMQFLGGCVQLGGALAISPRVRHRVQECLSRMGVLGEAREAAVIAALIGARSPQETLKLARGCFRTIAWDQLRAAGEPAGRQGAFADSDLAAASELHQRTQRTELGESDAFLSHSWRDDGASKWSVLCRWCHDFASANERPPLLFFDRACIDQKNIDDNLACLPVHLAGCSQLLVLAMTYCTRLWCLMELFAYVKMGGESRASLWSHS